ncbi:hypothetical protein J6590_093050 [Homalodisca vitripennis]|nr:hypothetical protein J6590_093050 [Homalodisca vitripennis]
MATALLRLVGEMSLNFEDTGHKKYVKLLARQGNYTNALCIGPECLGSRVASFDEIEVLCSLYYSTSVCSIEAQSQETEKSLIPE